MAATHIVGRLQPVGGKARGGRAGRVGIRRSCSQGRPGSASSASESWRLPARFGTVRGIGGFSRRASWARAVSEAVRARVQPRPCRTKTWVRFKKNTSEKYRRSGAACCGDVCCPGSERCEMSPLRSVCASSPAQIVQTVLRRDAGLLQQVVQRS